MPEQTVDTIEYKGLTLVRTKGVVRVWWCRGPWGLLQIYEEPFMACYRSGKTFIKSADCNNVQEALDALFRNLTLLNEGDAPRTRHNVFQMLFPLDLKGNAVGSFNYRGVNFRRALNNAYLTSDEPTTWGRFSLVGDSCGNYKATYDHWSLEPAQTPIESHWRGNVEGALDYVMDELVSTLACMKMLLGT